MPIALSHSHNVIIAFSVFDGTSYIPANTMPLNGANVPVASLLNAAIIIPFLDESQDRTARFYKM
ncbi:MAG: hypothetical protein M3156_05120 [Thermoproteota archaeon]|nr:hypothetical protein [Thermoproteota archaeon]